MKILICTGIYPPHVGGPAQYAKEIEDEFRRQGHSVKVLTYGLERKLPPLVRHKLFFFRTLFSLWNVDLVIALDTFSVGWPAVSASRLLGKKIIIRTGGDFLWESFVERTGEMVLFSKFYELCTGKFNLKERLIFFITKKTLKKASAIIFSTEWQRDIFTKAYSLNSEKNFIVENFYGPKIESYAPSKKIFVGGARQLKWKNIQTLRDAFSVAQKSDQELVLDIDNAVYGEFLDKIKNSYAVILVSIGDISPNIILDALRCNKPFILSKENGLYEKLKDVALFVDSQNVEDIAEKILYLSTKDGYDTQLKKIKEFNFVHTWQEITGEFLDVYNKISKKI